MEVGGTAHEMNDCDELVDAKAASCSDFVVTFLDPDTDRFEHHRMANG